MIKLINRVSGTEMWVPENRAAEYIAAGHKPADDAPPAPPAKKTIPPKRTSKK